MCRAPPSLRCFLSFLITSVFPKASRTYCPPSSPKVLCGQSEILDFLNDKFCPCRNNGWRVLLSLKCFITAVLHFGSTCLQRILGNNDSLMTLYIQAIQDNYQINERHESFDKSRSTVACVQTLQCEGAKRPFKL